MGQWPERMVRAESLTGTISCAEFLWSTLKKDAVMNMNQDLDQCWTFIVLKGVVLSVQPIRDMSFTVHE